MNINEVLSKVDHTLLGQCSTWEEIKNICDDGIKYKAASVCIPPSYVKRVKEYVRGNMGVCTVIGFPNGYNTKEVKIYETQNAIDNGADEIDMVVNLGDVRDGNFKKVLEEIKDIKKVCGNKILKVIIETCLLTEEEKIKLCKVVTESGADYIKTSTGFSKGGATVEDIKLFAENVGGNVKIKAAGGIGSISDAEEFIRLGADRLGTSRIIKIIKNESTQKDGY